MARTYNKGTLIIERTTFGQPENNAGYFLEYDNDLGAEYQVASNIAPDGYYKGVMMPTHDGGSGTHYHISFKNLTLGQLMKAIEADPNIPGAKAYLYSEGTNTHASNRANIKARLDVNQILSEVLPDKVTGAAGVADSGLGGLDFVLNFTEANAIDYVGFGESPLGDVVASTGWQTLSVSATVPDAPTDLSAASVDTGIFITFTAPISNGGSEITRYEATVNGGSSYFTVTNGGIIGETEGLVYGTSYDIQVRAVNDIGASAWSSPAVSAVAGTAPAVAPTINVTAVASDSITFEWASASGGSPGPLQHSYTIDNGVSFTLITESPVTVSGLTPETPYTIRIQGSNSVGPSPVAEVTETTLAESTSVPAPTNFVAVGSDFGLDITFTEPNIEIPYTVVRYEAMVNGLTTTLEKLSDQYLNGTDPSASVTAAYPISTDIYTLKSLMAAKFILNDTGEAVVYGETFGSNYEDPAYSQLRIRALVYNNSDLTVGEWSSNHPPVMAGIEPQQAPNNVTVTPTSSTSLQLSFDSWLEVDDATKPLPTLVSLTVGNGWPEWYQYAIKPSTDSVWSEWQRVGPEGEDYYTDQLIEGLNSNTSYDVKVRAVTTISGGFWYGPESVSVSGTTQAATAAPSTVRVIGVTSLNDTGTTDYNINVYYQQPFDNGSAITQYEVKVYEFGAIRFDGINPPTTGEALVTQYFAGANPSIVVSMAGYEGTTVVPIVRAENGDGWSEPSVGYYYGDDDEFNEGDLPAKVRVGSLILTPQIQSVSSVSGTGSVTLNWKDGAEGLGPDSSYIEKTVYKRAYKIYDGGGVAIGTPVEFTPVLPGDYPVDNPELSTEITGLAAGNYQFKVLLANEVDYASGNWIESDFSAVVTVDAVPAAPTFSLSYLQGQDSLQHLTASDGAEGDRFGTVSVSGDTAIVGAYTSAAGSAYIFTKVNGTWTETQKITASDGFANDWFGMGVSISGDTAIVGAGSDDSDTETNTGSAYIFTKVDGTWSETAKLTASDGAANDWFGRRVAISGDTAIVGANSDDNENGTDAGAAYIFTKVDGVWTQTQKIVASDGAASDSFGQSVAIDGDTAVVGISSSSERAAYIFTKVNGTWTETQKIVAFGGSSGDLFGQIVSISGDTVVVSARRDDDTGSDAGAVYVFTKDANGDWTQDQKITEPDAKYADNFGGSVAIDGDTLVVNSMNLAYVYSKDLSGTWVRTHRLVNHEFDNPLLSDNFTYVSVSGNSVLAGSLDDNSSTGSVCAFDLTNLQVSFEDPSDTSITDYEYAVSLDGGAWSDFVSLGGTTSPFTIEGIAYTQAVEVKLLARNSNGPSEESLDSITAITVPSNDLSFSASSVATGISISIDNPPSTGAAGYEFTVDGGSRYYTLPANGVITTDYGITLGQPYDVQVRAISLAGESEWSAATNVVAGP